MFNIENTEDIISPSLVFFEKQIDANIPIPDVQNMAI